VEWRTINKNKDEVPSDAEIVLLDDSESKYVSRFFGVVGARYGRMKASLTALKGWP
jgi:hypothetical protein